MVPNTLGQESNPPLYVVYGYRRDADEFARDRGIPPRDVIAVTEGVERLLGIRRPIVMVDTDHAVRKALQWHEISRLARAVNTSLGIKTEHIDWFRR